MDSGREKNHRGIEEIIEKTFRFSRNTRQVMEKKRKICISIMEIRFSSVDFLQRSRESRACRVYRKWTIIALVQRCVGRMLKNIGL